MSREAGRGGTKAIWWRMPLACLGLRGKGAVRKSGRWSCARLSVHLVFPTSILSTSRSLTNDILDPLFSPRFPITVRHGNFAGPNDVCVDVETTPLRSTCAFLFASGLLPSTFRTTTASLLVLYPSLAVSFFVFSYPSVCLGRRCGTTRCQAGLLTGKDRGRNGRVTGAWEELFE